MTGRQSEARQHWMARRDTDLEAAMWRYRTVLATGLPKLLQQMTERISEEAVHGTAPIDAKAEARYFCNGCGRVLYQSELISTAGGASDAHAVHCGPVQPAPPTIETWRYPEIAARSLAPSTDTGVTIETSGGENELIVLTMNDEEVILNAREARDLQRTIAQWWSRSQRIS